MARVVGARVVLRERAHGANGVTLLRTGSGRAVAGRCRRGGECPAWGLGAQLLATRPRRPEGTLERAGGEVLASGGARCVGW